MAAKHIYIIGAGAIGKALAVFLKNAGRSVTLIRGSVEAIAAKRERLRVWLDEETTMETEVEITGLSALPLLDGIVVLANKSYGNAQLAERLRGRTADSPLVLLQNGIGVERAFLQGGFEQVFRCVLFVSSQGIDEQSVRFKPVAACPVGVVWGDQHRLESIVGALHTTNFPFVPENNLRPVVWKKAIINSVFNTVCPLLETDNGVFHRHEAARGIARSVIDECVGVAGRAGIMLDPLEVEESLLRISRDSEGQFISTLQDIRHNRPTELETLNLEIVRIASAQDQAATVRRTGVLGELTKLKAELNQ
ncbi:ketopantoate reductase family protein [Pontibacter sp. FD36]|uniref:ketopantoate reductase family protein n=1 Tax=Pontibacter sp. FD36 TaxID=2789860 RepID=UPI0018A890D8|nr:2-dehydropantoate 2-reductase [Pontibacter sp. FD36]MBF8964081.1 ketopantoate reductase family protein [Pontibacter sp. FD36]